MNSKYFENIEYVLFDVAGTLLHKPGVITGIAGILTRAGVLVSNREVALRHKILSETTQFPDETTPDFYRDFNAKLLLSYIKYTKF